MYESGPIVPDLGPRDGYRTRPAGRGSAAERVRAGEARAAISGLRAPGVGFENEAATSGRARQATWPPPPPPSLATCFGAGGGSNGIEAAFSGSARRSSIARAPGRGGSNNVCSMGQIKASYWLATRSLLLVLSVGVTLTGGDARARACL